MIFSLWMSVGSCPQLTLTAGFSAESFTVGDSVLVMCSCNVLVFLSSTAFELSSFTSVSKILYGLTEGHHWEFYMHAIAFLLFMS